MIKDHEIHIKEFVDATHVSPEKGADSFIEYATDISTYGHIPLDTALTAAVRNIQKSYKQPLNQDESSREFAAISTARLKLGLW